MKQLVSKIDSRVRLIGLGDDAEARDGYVHFRLPIGVCTWNARDWELADCDKESEQGECPEFCKWLKETLKEKNYTLSGVSKSLGFSSNWLWSIVSGKRRLPEKRHSDLEKAIGLRRGEIARQLKKCTKPSPNPTI